jgi:hypothetical protein
VLGYVFTKVQVGAPIAVVAVTVTPVVDTPPSILSILTPEDDVLEVIEVTKFAAGDVPVNVSGVSRPKTRILTVVVPVVRAAKLVTVTVVPLNTQVGVVPVAAVSPDVTEQPEHVVGFE